MSVIYLKENVHKCLKELASVEGRTMSGEIQFLVGQRFKDLLGSPERRKEYAQQMATDAQRALENYEQTLVLDEAARKIVKDLSDENKKDKEIT